MKKLLLSCLFVGGFIASSLTWSGVFAQDKVKRVEDKTSVDWSKIKRELDLDAVDKEGKGFYAGLVINKDDKGNPVVLWVALIPDGKTFKFAMDANGDGKVEESELFATNPTDQQKKADPDLRYNYFNLFNPKILGMDFDSVLVMNVGDPAKYQSADVVFYSSKLNLGRIDLGDGALWASLKEAPVYDLCGFELMIEYWRNPPKLPLKGKKTVVFCLKTRGSAENVLAVMSHKLVDPKNFELTIKYPKAKGEFGELTKFIDCAC